MCQDLHIKVVQMGGPALASLLKATAPKLNAKSQQQWGERASSCTIPPW